MIYDTYVTYTTGLGSAPVQSQAVVRTAQEWYLDDGTILPLRSAQIIRVTQVPTLSKRS